VKEILDMGYFLVINIYNAVNEIRPNARTPDQPYSALSLWTAVTFLLNSLVKTAFKCK
jgi:hypothetical protein